MSITKIKTQTNESLTKIYVSEKNNIQQRRRRNAHLFSPALSVEEKRREQHENGTREAKNGSFSSWDRTPRNS